MNAQGLRTLFFKTGLPQAYVLGAAPEEEKRPAAEISTQEEKRERP